MTNEQQPADPAREAMRAAARRIDTVNPWLRIGGAIPADEFGRLAEAGVPHVIDLREEHEVDASRLDELPAARRHVPVANHAAPTHEQLQDLTAWIAEQDGQPTVYVHCQGGFGRASTMAIGLLVQQGISVEEAEQQVRTARPEIRLNDDQRAWLKSVEERRAQGS
jgi:protein-tyrosine phosphatase